MVATKDYNRKIAVFQQLIVLSAIKNQPNQCLRGAMP